MGLRLSKISLVYSAFPDKRVIMKNALKETTNKQLRENEYRLEEMVKIRTAELTRALLQLEEARNAAESAKRAKSTFLTNTSHELRTPLNAILGYTQILQLEEPTSALLQKGLQTIQTSGEYLLSIINDILDLARIEAGGSDSQQNAFHLPLLLETLGKMMRILAEEKNITFNIYAFDFKQNRPATGLPAILRGDEKRLRQTLINLLGNAIKFTNRGSVTLKVGFADNPKTNGKDKTRTQLFRFQIEDTRPGANADYAEKIISPSRQKNPAYNFQENGLALVISRRFIKTMGGQLQVKSAPKQGSVFWFDIPLLQISNQERNAVNFPNEGQFNRQDAFNYGFSTTH